MRGYLEDSPSTIMSVSDGGPKPIFGTSTTTVPGQGSNYTPPVPKGGSAGGPGKPLDFSAADAAKAKREEDMRRKREAIEEQKAQAAEEERMKQLEEVEEQKLHAAMNDLKQALINDNSKNKKVRPLDFSNVPSVPQHVTPNPGALFVDPKTKAIVDLAIKSAHEKFANLGTSLNSVESQIRQLIPLTITGVVSWGDAGLTQSSQMVTKSAGTLKMFSELRGNELVETAIKASAQVNTGFFQRLAGHTSVIGYKGNLTALKSQIMSLLPEIDTLTAKLKELQSKISINLAALSSVCEAIGDIQDSSLSIAVDNRRRILAQNVQQSDLSVQQLQQAKNLMVDQLSRASQLLDVTIPAFETANATK